MSTPWTDHGFRPELHNNYVRVRASGDNKEEPIPEQSDTELEAVKESSFFNE